MSYKTFANFITTFDSENTRKVARSLSELGEHDYKNCTPIDVEQIILSMKPSSLKAITTISYMLSLYAKYIENDDLYHIAKDVDRSALWSMAKPMAKKKFISYPVFKSVYNEIGVYEEYNSFYIQTLFRCLYEGIYSDDMSVIKNLRGSDIKEVLCEHQRTDICKLPDGKFFNFQNDKLKSSDGKFLYEYNKELPDGKFLKNQNKKLPDGKSERQRSCRFMRQRSFRFSERSEGVLNFQNVSDNILPYKNIVTLREDSGHEYELLISNGLARDLKKLADINIWERRNRFGTCKIKTTGLHEDSCFKVETRKDSSDYSYRYTYYRILRKISKEYLEYNLLPLQLYISGIMHRIEINLNKHGVELKDAFSSRNKNRTVNKIISEELKRCNCNTEVKNFREMVIGHLDVFI